MLCGINVGVVCVKCVYMYVYVVCVHVYVVYVCDVLCVYMCCVCMVCVWRVWYKCVCVCGMCDMSVCVCVCLELTTWDSTTCQGVCPWADDSPHSSHDCLQLSV